MFNVLYITNVHNSYRDEFFEQLGREVNLTVLFERCRSTVRDARWWQEKEAVSYKEIFLPDGNFRFCLSFMESVISQGWDAIVIGCFNSIWQMFAMLFMRRNGIPYTLNLDGLLFRHRNLVKEFGITYFLSGAMAYLIAGEKGIPSLQKRVGKKARIQSYPFSSQTSSQVIAYSKVATMRDPNLILTIGRFEDYKGLDVLVEAARAFPDKRFKIVGMGEKQEKFDRLICSKGLSNLETVDFLSSEELIGEYARASLFVLPSRQECWGLVVNEAAAVGCPIVSTWGSGAAVEFLSDDYPQFLAEPGNSASLVRAISEALVMGGKELERYQAFLKKKASSYTIEASVSSHMELFATLAKER